MKRSNIEMSSAPVSTLGLCLCAKPPTYFGGGLYMCTEGKCGFQFVDAINKKKLLGVIPVPTDSEDSDDDNDEVPQTPQSMTPYDPNDPRVLVLGTQEQLVNFNLYERYNSLEYRSTLKSPRSRKLFDKDALNNHHRILLEEKEYELSNIDIFQPVHPSGNITARLAWTGNKNLIRIDINGGNTKIVVPYDQFLKFFAYCQADISEN